MQHRSFKCLNIPLPSALAKTDTQHKITQLTVAISTNDIPTWYLQSMILYEAAMYAFKLFFNPCRFDRWASSHNCINVDVWFVYIKCTCLLLAKTNKERVALDSMLEVKNSISVFAQQTKISPTYHEWCAIYFIPGPISFVQWKTHIACKT